MKLSLRTRLTAWYSMIVMVTLTALGVIAYFAVSNELNQNLDVSLTRVASSLDKIIQKKQAETQKPLKPASPRKRRTRKERRAADSVKRDSFAFFRQSETANSDSIIAITDTLPEDDQNPVWSAVYEHILLNSKNYYIQIADFNNQVVYRSENLQPDSLPVFQTHGSDTVDSKKFVHYTLHSQQLRLYVGKTKSAQISIGYTVEEIQETLNSLFSYLLVAFPIVVIFSTLGGWFLAKVSLQPVDDITRSAQEITAHNLSQRLPMPAANDEIARLTATLNQMIERLEASFIQIRQFTSDASHELRTPLAILMGELEVALRSPKSSEQYRNILASAQEEVTRLSKVVRNLLEISRAESGQVKIDMEKLDISILLRDICEDIELLAEEKSQTLETIIEPNITILGDGVRLHQAFLNILDNAVKYTQIGGSILVRLVSESGYAVLRVSDSGVGIPHDDLAHIFDRFYRVDKARSQDVQGNGLGLAIVKWIVEAHHGTITAESIEGKGTIFTVRLKEGK
ncbi:MAG: heavy metal sensor histidine kinase [Bacteroidetes bacterium]|nr:heavy metal sensor histidine kinase [Bacteroidota bacterium]